MPPPVRALYLAAAAAAAMVAVTYLGSSRGVSETDGAGVTRKIIERTDIAGTDEELRLMLVELPPSYSVAPHRHSVAGLCYVIEGSAESQYEGEAARVVSEGGSFQDEPGKTHLIFRNDSPTRKLSFLCFAKIKKNQEYLLPK